MNCSLHRMIGGISFLKIVEKMLLDCFLHKMWCVSHTGEPYQDLLWPPDCWDLPWRCSQVLSLWASAAIFILRLHFLSKQTQHESLPVKTTSLTEKWRVSMFIRDKNESTLPLFNQPSSLCTKPGTVSSSAVEQIKCWLGRSMQQRPEKPT